MARSGSKKVVIDKEAQEETEKRRLYVVVTMILVVTAMLSVIVTPRGTGLKGCLGIILTQSRYSCLASFALSTKNSSVCGYIQSQPPSDQCYIGVAEETYNASVCNSAQDKNQSAFCLLFISNATNSSAPCGYLTGGAYSSCSTRIALKLNSQAICSGISSQTGRLVCSSSLYTRRASLLGDPSLCANVTGVISQSLTAMIVSNSSLYTNSTNILNINPIAFFALSNFSYSPRDLCYFQVATGRNTARYCRSISNLTLQGFCNSSIITHQLNATPSNSTLNLTSLLNSCNQYSSFASQCRSVVLIAQALNTRNTSICSQLSTQFLQYQCYASLARAYNNSAYCAFITNATANSACVSNIRFNFS